MLTITELLALRGLDLHAKIMMARHQRKRHDISEIVARGYLEDYQRYQSKAKFDCEYLVSFFATESTRARFYGVYRVGRMRPALEVPLPKDHPYPEFLTPGGFVYELAEVNGFEDLKNRVVIEWGRNTINWAQWLTPKEVVEITAKGKGRHFPGYQNVILSYTELVNILTHATANKEWHMMLGAVAGVYLITNDVTGQQYVGSAYGDKGILGRWLIYARRADGGNKLLKKLLAGDMGYAKNLRFSILETLPKNMTKAEALGRETFHKLKLGTRAHGLNAN